MKALLLARYLDQKYLKTVLDGRGCKEIAAALASPDLCLSICHIVFMRFLLLCLCMKVIGGLR